MADGSNEKQKAGGEADQCAEEILRLEAVLDTRDSQIFL